MSDRTENFRHFAKRLSVQKSRAPFLSIYFALPSYLQSQIKMLAIFMSLCSISLACASALSDDEGQAFALGLIFPGAGFLQWAVDGQLIVSLIVFAAILSLFALALIIWFATGNIVLPPLIWIGGAFAAAHPIWFGLQPGLMTKQWGLTLPLALPLLAAVTIAVGANRRRKPIAAVIGKQALPPASPKMFRDEIGYDDLCRIRILLDRALQPVERFDGFEWRDQFQTAAVRYQINFLSYALSVAQANYLPATTGYYSEAQNRLLAKQGDRRIWRYWALENLWGNFRLGRDPVPKDNIMFTGFVGLQMALAGTGAPLILYDRGKEWRRYSLHEMADLLTAQYERAPYGLLACEPNWIYPLCNMITACSLRAADEQDGEDRWARIASQFKDKLIREFTDSSGNFIAFRSSVTGLAPPSPGGAVMQAFPCLFLNSLHPDLAAERWEQLRNRLADENWKRAFWPIDVGNYGFSRASSYAASAAAAIEMGDGDTAKALLDRLEEECPSQTVDGVTHRHNASLWAHALELTACLGRKDGLRTMLQRQGPACRKGPFLAAAPYPDAMVARATSSGQQLNLVLYPADKPQRVSLTIAGLHAGRHYRAGLAAEQFLKADRLGMAELSIMLSGRTELSITPVI
jgi:Linalool dehydratase/isomerase